MDRVLGLKALKLLSDEVLISPYGGTVWTVQGRATQITAICRRDEFYPFETLGFSHRAPHQECSCGFYGAFSYGDLYPSLFNRKADIWCLIEGWGEIVFHERGWRSHYARVVGIIGKPWCKYSRYRLIEEGNPIFDLSPHSLGFSYTEYSPGIGLAAFEPPDVSEMGAYFASIAVRGMSNLQQFMIANHRMLEIDRRAKESTGAPYVMLTSFGSIPSISLEDATNRMNDWLRLNWELYA